MESQKDPSYLLSAEAEFRRKGKQLLPVRNHSPLAIPEALNQSCSVDFMHDSRICGRRFRTFNVVDDFNLEALSIEIDLNAWFVFPTGSRQTVAIRSSECFY